MPYKALTIKIDGTSLSDKDWDYVINVVVETDLEQPDMAVIRIHDPELAYIDGSTFKLGKALEINGVSDKNVAKLLFKGEVTALEPEWTTEESSLVIRAYDRSHRLYRGTKLRTFMQKTDSQIAQTIAQENGLQADVTATSIQHDYVVQYNQSDLEFLRSRAERIGYRVQVNDRKLVFKPAESSPPNATNQVWGDTLLEFNARLSAVAQPNSVEIRSWDPKEKKEVVGKASRVTASHSLGESRSGGAIAQSAFGSAADWSLSDLSVRTNAEAKSMAQAVLDQQNGETIHAQGRALGDPSLLAGCLVPVDGIGKTFSGKYFVTSTRHEYTPAEGYMTLFVVNGFEPFSLAPRSYGQAPSSVPGVAVGVVTSLSDPDNLGRVKVKFPWCSDTHESDWAWVTSLGAGNNRGFHMAPEINDQVLVSFENGQINRPFVIGGLWSTKDALPGSSTADGKVKIRALKLRSGSTLQFTEDEGSQKGVIDLISGDKRSLSIDDNNKKLALTSQSHSIMLDDTGKKVVIDAASTLELKCGANSIVLSTSGVEIKGSGGSLVIGASGVELKSNSNLILNSNAMAELSCNAIMTIKTSAIMNIQGTLVKIN